MRLVEALLDYNNVVARGWRYGGVHCPPRFRAMLKPRVLEALNRSFGSDWKEEDP